MGSENGNGNGANSLLLAWRYALVSDLELSRSAKFVGICLSLTFTKYGSRWLGRCSRGQLVAWSGYGLTTVKDALRELVDGRYVQRLYAGGGRLPGGRGIAPIFEAVLRFAPVEIGGAQGPPQTPIPGLSPALEGSGSDPLLGFPGNTTNTGRQETPYVDDPSFQADVEAALAKNPEWTPVDAMVWVEQERKRAQRPNAESSVPDGVAAAAGAGKPKRKRTPAKPRKRTKRAES
jgi:hypothetical protein